MRRRRGRRRTVLTVGVAVSVLLGVATVAQAMDTGRRPAGTRAAPVAVRGIRTADTLPGPNTSTRLRDGSLSYGTWQGHRIVLPAGLVPPGGRLTTVVVGRGPVAFYCVNGAFVETEPLISLFSLKGRTVGLHYLGPNAAIPLSWGSSVDGSRADMAVVKTMANRGTAPRVLLRAVLTAGGPRTTFGGTTAIVRLPITGGAAPATACLPAQRATVPLLTFYLVFKGGTTGSHS